jgi:ABC-type antimicrobial peptide transport system permease subunit
MILCGAFALATLMLALVAMYAISAHEVTTRRREFGIRIALGATPAVIFRLIFKNGIVLGLAAIAGGAVIALAVTPALQALLFGVAAVDWPVYGVAVAIVLATCVAGTAGPALRGRATNPGLVMWQE